MLRLMIALVLIFTAPAVQAGADDAVLADGRAKSDAFLSGDFDAIWQTMTPELRKALGGVEALKQFGNELGRSLGSEKQILEENVRREGDLRVYMRTAHWTRADAPMLMQWAFDEAGKIAGFFVRQIPVPADSPFLDYETKASLRLPFNGEWFVFWGGRTLERNYHAANEAQRFALDFLVRKDGASHSGDPSRLDSYYCWNRRILAPAPASVVAAVDGLPDQPVGEMDPAHPAGNHVVLDLGHGEFAFLAHLKRGSVTVSEGDKVKTGQEIGRCGNSGNSSEPHLHFHLQTTPDLHAGQGLPAFFENYGADGEPVARGEPQRGQTVTPDGKLPVRP